MPAIRYMRLPELPESAISCTRCLPTPNVAGPLQHRSTFPMRILAIESSCDESAAAVLDSAAGLLAHELFSQVELHRVYGGVVPELASRDHVQRLLPLVTSALTHARTAPT